MKKEAKLIIIIATAFTVGLFLIFLWAANKTGKVVRLDEESLVLEVGQ